MSETLETLAAAVTRLEDVVNQTVNTGKVTDELVKLALAMVEPTLRLLRYDVRMLETCTSDEQRARVERASEAAGDMAIARAVLGRTSASASSTKEEK